MTQIGIQLYSFRHMLPAQLATVLDRLIQVGYTGVEPYRGLPPAETMELIRRHDLQIPSAHLSAPVGDAEAPTLEAAEIYGLKQIIVPFLPREDFQAVDIIKRNCDMLNRAAAIARRHGYSLGYHSHWWEFQPVPDDVNRRTGHEIMHVHLDPDIFFQIDTYFVKMAGLDPAQVISDLKARIPTLHIKDGPGQRDEPNMAIGAGIMDFPSIRASHPSVPWWIVEIERCEKPVLDVADISYNYAADLLDNQQ